MPTPSDRYSVQDSKKFTGYTFGRRERETREGWRDGGREAAWLLALCCAKPKIRYKLRVRGLGNVTEVAWTGGGTAQPTL